MTPVQIYNEAGTAIVATGHTINGGATVTGLNAPVARHREYQLSVAGGPRVGKLCTQYDAVTNSATFV